MTERQKNVPAPRATGFASAVLLVVLLATSGWPCEAHALVDNTYVTSCESSQTEVGRVVAGSRPCADPEVVRVCAQLPRVRSRAQRVDSWGLPPARAPTA
ncbi:MAG: hypothetical protein ACI89X_001792 [Planctomycetota bacterium]